MLEHRKRVIGRVVVCKDHEDQLLADIVVALVGLEALSPAALASDDFDVQINPFDGDTWHLVLSASPFNVLVKLLVEDGTTDGSLKLVVQLPSHEDYELCSTDVPSGGWESSEAALLGN